VNITLAQISPKLNRAENIKSHLKYIDKYKNQSDLIIFPELSLNGYLMMDLVFEEALYLDELEKFKKASFDVDILLGLALRDGHKIFNSAIYFQNGKILNIHKKNNLPNYGMFEEARYFFSANEIDSFDNSHFNCTTLICEDVWSSSIIDRVVKLNSDVIFVLANSPARGFKDELIIEKKWESLLNTLAILSGAYVIFVNRVGFEDGLGFWGGSRVVTPNITNITKAQLFEDCFINVKLDDNLVKREKYFLRG
jgi:predicted amidohydrolase